MYDTFYEYLDQRIRQGGHSKAEIARMADMKPQQLNTIISSKADCRYSTFVKFERIFEKLKRKKHSEMSQEERWRLQRG